MADITTPQNPFAINEAEYRQKLEPAYRYSGFAPQSLVQYAVVLPFHLPVPDETIFSIYESDEAICTFHFSTMTLTEQVPSGAVGNDLFPLPRSYSRIEMIYASSEDLVWSQDFDASSYFDILVKTLNMVITAYMLYTKDSEAYRVATVMFQPNCFWRLVKTQPWSVGSLYLMILHAAVPYVREPIDKSTLDRVVWYTNVLKQEWNPFVWSEEIWVQATGQLRTGRYREAVIDAQTSVETFLGTLFEQLLVAEGKTTEEAIAAHEGTAFMAMVKKEFHPRLGGTWDPDQDNTAVGTWHRDTYDLRNRITHAGYFPRVEEVEPALRAAQDLRLYVVSLIRGKRQKYPGLQRFVHLQGEHHS